MLNLREGDSSRSSLSFLTRYRKPLSLASGETFPLRVHSPNPLGLSGNTWWCAPGVELVDLFGSGVEKNGDDRSESGSEPENGDGEDGPREEEEEEAELRDKEGERGGMGWWTESGMPVGSGARGRKRRELKGMLVGCEGGGGVRAWWRSAARVSGIERGLRVG